MAPSAGSEPQQQHGPKRLRRLMAHEFESTLWDVSCAEQVCQSVGYKKCHAGQLARHLSARVVSAAAAAGSWPLRPDSQAPMPWSAIGVNESSLQANGCPRRLACSVLADTRPFATSVGEVRTSQDGSTTKMAIRLHDEHTVESVIIRHGRRTTLCVSSQIGCQMGCTFCATGTMPVVGDLAACEIVEQLLHAHAFEAAQKRPPVRNVVFMGMGEPLNNYSAVVTAVKTMCSVDHLGELALQQSRVTVSTVGVPSRMRQLSVDLPSASLALSLHAPTQELRQRIVPSAKHAPLGELLAALDKHSNYCKRPSPTAFTAMVEYVLLAGVNDSDECAMELGALMQPRKKDVMVNLIPYNPGANSGPESFDAPSHEVVERFQQVVVAYGVTTRVRREMGRDIAGACGQLANTRNNRQQSDQHPGLHVADVEDSRASSAPQGQGAYSEHSQGAAAAGAPPRREDDFVAWRRQQPKSRKAAVNENVLAMVEASQASQAAPTSQASQASQAAPPPPATPPPTATPIIAQREFNVSRDPPPSMAGSAAAPVGTARAPRAPTVGPAPGPGAGQEAAGWWHVAVRFVSWLAKLHAPEIASAGILGGVVAALALSRFRSEPQGALRV